MVTEPHLYKSVNMDLAERVAILEGEVNQRDEFIQRMLVVLGEIAPAAAVAIGMEAPPIRRYES